jgi:DNA segregation ATPase FtsK/SpoIIIE, S-DNA-T family
LYINEREILGRKRKYPKHKQKEPKWYQAENEWGDFVFDWKLGLEKDTWREIFGILIFLFSLVVSLGFFGWAGVFGSELAKLMRLIFGNISSYLFAIGFMWFGLSLLVPKISNLKLSNIVGFILLLLSCSAFFHLFIPTQDAREAAFQRHGGGLLGYAVSDPMVQNLGLFMAFLIIIALIVIAILMMANISIRSYFGLEDGDESEKEEGRVRVNQPESAKAGANMMRSLRNRINTMKESKSKKQEVSRAPVVEIDSKMLAKDKDWRYPPLEILKDVDEAPNPGNIEKNVEIIQKTLNTFGVEVTPGEVNIGPTVTQYTFKPKEGIKLAQITARAQDLALALASRSLRIEAPIPGKSSVGIENPNIIPAKVTLREVLKSKQFKAVKSKLAIALGRGVSGDSEVVDLEKMPHLLIAGATGSGKSVCINSVIASLLFNNSPRDLRLVLVDPKRVELTNYNDIPHLLTPVITEVDKTVSALKWGIDEMERRYKLFASEGKRNIIAYNQSPGEEGKLPYIVIIIDELADLMAQAASDVENSIVRLAQMARATGMHLIVATQRPSVDVITGLIKANIPARIAFSTASQADSRTILDMSGSEKLLGNGDMLFLGNGLNKPKRMQGCFVSDKELEDLVKHLKSEQEPQYDETILQYRSTKSGGMTGGMSGDDDMYEEAARVVIGAKKASASFLQRRLRVGYARAARLLDILESNGVVGPAEGQKPREVLVMPGEEDSIFNQHTPTADLKGNISTHERSNAFSGQVKNGTFYEEDYEEIEKDYK